MELHLLEDDFDIQNDFEAQIRTGTIDLTNYIWKDPGKWMGRKSTK